jgi:hypothetical protein
MGMINKISTKAFPNKDDIRKFQKDKLAKEPTTMAALQVVSVEDEKEESDQ